MRLLTDELGAVTDTYEYGAYGEVLRAMGATENPYLYRGESLDSELGLQYLRVRYYEPETGRFLSTDPFEGMVESPVFRHRYLYANANPISFEDPSGAFSIGQAIAATQIISTLSSLPLASSYNPTFIPASILQSSVSNRQEDDFRWEGWIVSGEGRFTRLPYLGIFPAKFNLLISLGLSLFSTEIGVIWLGFDPIEFDEENLK